MTEVGNAVSCSTIQVLHAICIEQQCALSAHYGQLLFDVHTRGMFIFNVKDFVCIHKRIVHWITVPFPARALDIGSCIRPSAMMTRPTPPFRASSAPSTFFFIRPCAVSL